LKLLQSIWLDSTRRNLLLAAGSIIRSQHYYVALFRQTKATDNLRLTLNKPSTFGHFQSFVRVLYGFPDRTKLGTIGMM